MCIHVVSLNRLDNDWAIRHVIECCLVQESAFVFRGKARRANLVLSGPYLVIKGSLSMADSVQELGSIFQGF